MEKQQVRALWQRVLRTRTGWRRGSGGQWRGERRPSHSCSLQPQKMGVCLETGRELLRFLFSHIGLAAVCTTAVGVGSGAEHENGFRNDGRRWVGFVGDSGGGIN